MPLCLLPFGSLGSLAQGLVAWTKGLLDAKDVSLFLLFWGFELVKIMRLL